ncbi:VC0807 family protein [Streptomyces hirsutus]|uniref:VC0807 family protein n=1 Tax=Streptomyces hirsutus TaxID=35620 RepID=UPI0036BB2B08
MRSSGRSFLPPGRGRPRGWVHDDALGHSQQQVPDLSADRPRRGGADRGVLPPQERFGASAFVSLAWSSVIPAARTGWAAVTERTLNAFAALILFVNVVSLLLGFVSGDARLILVKESAVGSVIGIGVLVYVMLGKPMMTTGMKPWVTRGQAAREAAPLPSSSALPNSVETEHNSSLAGPTHQYTGALRSPP